MQKEDIIEKRDDSEGQMEGIIEGKDDAGGHYQGRIQGGGGQQARAPPKF